MKLRLYSSYYFQHLSADISMTVDLCNCVTLYASSAIDSIQSFVSISINIHSKLRIRKLFLQHQNPRKHAMVYLM